MKKLAIVIAMMFASTFQANAQFLTEPDLSYNVCRQLSNLAFDFATARDHGLTKYEAGKEYIKPPFNNDDMLPIATQLMDLVYSYGGLTKYQIWALTVTRCLSNN